MKAFFEEYGFIVLSAIVVLILITMAEPVGQMVGNSSMGIVKDLTDSVDIKKYGGLTFNAPE